MSFETPIDGTFSEFGDPIPFKVKVVDPEDGTIDCTKIRVTYSLGHNEHAHQQDEAAVKADCTGVITPARDAGHGGTAYVYHVVQAFYTDAGGAGGTPALTGEAGTVLHPRSYAAETYQKGEGVGLYVGKLFVPGSGDWFMFPRINVKDIKALRTQIYSYGTGATVTVRADSPTGPVLARYTDIPSMPARTGLRVPRVPVRSPRRSPTPAACTTSTSSSSGLRTRRRRSSSATSSSSRSVTTETTGTVGGTVPATLAVSLGAPATFGAFTPGVAQGVHGEHDGHRHLHRRRRHADRQRPEPDRHRPSGQRRRFALPQPLQGLGHGQDWTGPTSNDTSRASSSRPSAPTTRYAPAPTARP